MTSRAEEIQIVADWIGSYLREHPEAADSVEGIQRWWLTPAGFEAPITCVAEAAERLVAEGQMVRNVLPDGRRVFAGRRST